MGFDIIRPVDNAVDALSLSERGFLTTPPAYQTANYQPPGRAALITK